MALAATATTAEYTQQACTVPPLEACKTCATAFNVVLAQNPIDEGSMQINAKDETE